MIPFFITVRFAGADCEAPEEAEETADVGSEPLSGHGQVQGRLHPVRHWGQQMSGLHWSWCHHRVQTDGTPRQQTQHHREQQILPPLCQSAGGEESSRSEDHQIPLLLLLLRPGLLIRPRHDSLSSNLQLPRPRHTQDRARDSVETFLTSPLPSQLTCDNYSKVDNNKSSSW